MRSGSKPATSTGEISGVRATPILTGIERGILDFMVLYLRTNTYQPSIREIGQEFGIKSTKTVSEHLQALADKGFIERDPSRSRAVRILSVDLAPSTVSLPCFRTLEDAARGAHRPPAEAHFSLDRRLAGGEGGFLVRAPGEALADAGIRDGDLLVISPVAAEELEDGELIAARVGGDADYYRLRKMGSRNLLHPTGGEGARAAISEPASLVLLGRVSALCRRVDPLPSTAPIAH
ncbi:MAG: transcriptional repressor LexA [Gemmatimonadetes bacterium]|nr:transcriptional repressor LexA [Gemmatimonadota bacterium]